jgi:hypothetical protein
MEPIVKAVKNDVGEHWIGVTLIQQLGQCCSECGLPTTTVRVLAAKYVVEIFDRVLAAGAVTGVDGGNVSMSLLSDMKPLVRLWRNLTRKVRLEMEKVRIAGVAIPINLGNDFFRKVKSSPMYWSRLWCPRLIRIRRRGWLWMVKLSISKWQQVLGIMGQVSAAWVVAC